MALRRAGEAAALSAIGRGIYAALVETLREKEDGRPTPSKHRENLPLVIEEHVNAALRLKLDDLEADVGSLPKPVMVALRETVAWLAGGARDLIHLRDAYAVAEWSRKIQRARLTPDLNGRERRLEWDSASHALAEPLHFRWGNIKRLLLDLEGGDS
jgi:hypothetical protein